MTDNNINYRGVKLNSYNQYDILELIKYNLTNSITLNVFYINAYLFLSIIKNKEILKVLNDGLLINDGIGMNLLIRILKNNNHVKKTVTTDIWHKVLDLCSELKLRIVVYGGERNKRGNIVRFLNQFPGIELLEYSDGYSNLDITKLKADIIFVGLGSFKQELYIESISDKNNIPIKIAVGSAIDFWTGAKKRAPLWMQKTGLEWLYRLFQEPKRLWKRYIIGIPVFMFNIIVIKVKLMLKKEST
ncbi:MAG: WecB/TagA/CpsF family glycosyltransferase [Ignavibacteria bacterium]